MFLLIFPVSLYYLKLERFTLNYKLREIILMVIKLHKNKIVWILSIYAILSMKHGNMEIKQEVSIRTDD